MENNFGQIFLDRKKIWLKKFEAKFWNKNLGQKLLEEKNQDEKHFGRKNFAYSFLECKIKTDTQHTDKGTACEHTARQQTD